MESKLQTGTTRIAHTRSGESGQDEVVVASFDSNGVVVKWPRAIAFAEAFAVNNKLPIPSPLIMRDGGGWLTLTQGRSAGASISSLEHSEQVIHYGRAIQTGFNGADYEGVNGMTSEVDGLAKWSKRIPVTTKLDFDESRHLIESVSVVAQNLEPLELGGDLKLSLETSYSHNPTPKRGVFSVCSSLLVRSRSAELVDWSIHSQSHHMIQDLMCLVYGRPCFARLISVMREDDQELEPTDDRRFWRNAFEPEFGRGTADSSLAERNEPLFYLDEADSSKIATWLAEFTLWSRPTWIAMTALFHKELPVQSQLLQIAVALEALGYAIAKKESPDAKVKDSYEQLLDRVFGAIGYAPVAVVGVGGSVDEWSRAFNSAYKGVKHADNPLTDGLDAWKRSKEGMTLIRCWIASELGVAEDLVTRRLREAG